MNSQRILNLFSFILIFNILIESEVKGQCITPFVSLGNDTVICDKGALILDAGVFNEYNWSDGYTGRFLNVTSPGKYWVNVLNSCSDKGTDTIIIEKAPDFNLSIDVPLRDYFCKGEVIDLIAVIDKPAVIINYAWSVSNENVATVSIDSSRTITLTATDQYGCQKVKSKDIEYQYPYEKDSLLLVTYDNQEDRYVAVYKRTSGKRTRSFILYNGIASLDSLTSTSFEGVNQIIDYKTNPHLGAKIYNLQAEDSCGNRSKLSIDKAHRTSHLKITREANDFTTLSWNRYIGFQYDYFYIYKGTSQVNGTIVDSVFCAKGIDNFSWTDPTKAGEIFYYQVSVKTPFVITLDPGKKASSGPYLHSLSNLEDNRLSSNGVNSKSFADNLLQIFPNPYKGSTKIRYNLNSDAVVSIKVYNFLGQMIAEIDNGRKSAGLHETGFSASEYGNGPGIYYLKFEIDGKALYLRKLIEEQEF
jgi:hypothetical protein